jgi:hypothetical protein
MQQCQYDCTLPCTCHFRVCERQMPCRFDIAKTSKRQLDVYNNSESCGQLLSSLYSTACTLSPVPVLCNANHPLTRAHGS